MHHTSRCGEWVTRADADLPGAEDAMAYERLGAAIIDATRSPGEVTDGVLDAARQIALSRS